MKLNTDGYKDEIETIKRIILDLKAETGLHFIQNEVEVKKEKQYNMWYNILLKNIQVSCGTLEGLKTGYFNKEDLRVMLAHEFGHAAKPPQFLKNRLQIVPSIVFCIIILAIFYYYQLLICLTPIILLVISYTFILLFAASRREWERMADNYALKIIKDPEKYKSVVNKTRPKRTTLSKIMKKKPFYYFGLKITYEEKIKIIENYI